MMNAITSSFVIMRSIGLIMSYPYEFVVYYEIHRFQTRDGFVSVNSLLITEIDKSIQLHLHRRVRTGSDSELTD